MRRALSTAYYAMFHCLCRCCADCMIGTRSATRSEGAWRQTYRAVEHGHTKSVCGDAARMALFPREIQDFANTFTAMQLKRHEADYDPVPTLYKSSVITDIDTVSNAIEDFLSCPLKDRRAFAAYVLLRKRRS